VLREETEAARTEALQSRGKISDDRLKTLENLDRLVEISDKLKAPKPHKRWPVAAILGACLLIISLLLFVKRQSTEIELDLTLTDLRFKLSDQALFVDKMQFSALGVSGLKEIQLPRAQSQAIKSFQLSVAEEKDPEDKKPPKSLGTISLTDLLLPKGTLVELNCSELPNRYRLSLEIPGGDPPKLTVSVKGKLHVALPGAGEQLEYSSPKTIRMQAVSQQITLDMSVPGGTQEAFSFLQAQDFRFSRIEEYMDTDETYIRRVPTVLSGALYFAELNGRKYPLREGEDLRFEQSEGQIRSLKLEKNRLSLKFFGDVEGMSSGWETTRVKLMPTWLTWLQARQGLGLLWGTSFFLFGIVTQIVRWWKKG
ncbi:MAG: hypothetical protein GY801_12945, partial [bacterium]|nr:hypothetical protein [bacterium]